MLVLVRSMVMLATDPDVRAQIATRFPDAVDGETVDRQSLGAAVFADPAARADLEAPAFDKERGSEGGAGGFG